MRQRTKMSGLEAHVTPDGNARICTTKGKCRKGINKLESLIKEGYKLANASVRRDKDPKEVVITISGWEALGSITVTFKSFKKDNEGKPVKIIKEIF